MVALTINNSFSRLTGLSSIQEKEIKKALSYTVGGSAAFFGGFGPKKRSLIDKKGFFPTGLLHRLPPWAIAVKDERKKPQPTPGLFKLGLNDAIS